MTARTTVLSIAAICIAAAGASFAGGHESEVPAAVKARQAYMSLGGFYLGEVFAMGTGKVAYDADAAARAAANLDTLTGIDQRAFWPAGTDSESIDGTRALPVIWEDFEGIAAKGMEYSNAVDNLVAVAGDGQEALLEAAKAVGDTCNACHEDYRVPNN